ncbi:Retrovirus-related Pol polyprotein from transposon TNT 1-94 [Sesamum angolense]|uniref:Retrovirus-related Pol polyprotein from transposon TNT 1-94 n=1 Tax=Sesamum angolense TaxID=2727404 RepID=A0AAE2BM23_9LAMI|nr:Retrovirus-related Pol polyprotein from transposon TNT 1-94 [Sesamum angolense]
MYDSPLPTKTGKEANGVILSPKNHGSKYWTISSIRGYRPIRHLVVVVEVLFSILAVNGLGSSILVILQNLPKLRCNTGTVCGERSRGVLKDTSWMKRSKQQEFLGKTADSDLWRTCGWLMDVSRNAGAHTSIKQRLLLNGNCNIVRMGTFLMCGDAIRQSFKQATTAYSTTEAECIADSQAAKEVIWMKNYIQKLGVLPSIAEPVVIFYDSNGAIAQANELRSHHHSKHIVRCYHLLREMVSKGDVRMDPVSSAENTTYLLIKLVSQIAHTQHLDNMGLRSMVDWL